MNVLVLIIGLISFLGLFAGFFLAKITSYELKDGQKYFLIVRKALFLIICALAVYESGYLFIAIGILLIGSLLFLAKDFSDLMFAVLIFPIAISSSVTIPALVFFYALVDSAILVHNKFDWLDILKKRFYFPLLLVLLYFSLQLF